MLVQNKTLCLKSCDPESQLPICESYAGYQKILIGWPHTEDRPYLLEKCIRDIQKENPEAEIILCTGVDKSQADLLTPVIDNADDMDVMRFVPKS